MFQKAALFLSSDKQASNMKDHLDWVLSHQEPQKQQ